MNLNKIDIDKNYLKFSKVYPKENYHNYNIHSFYIYCYLDPFNLKFTKYNIFGEDIYFAYEPIYIGKATTFHGYRHNQHIMEFLNGKDSEEKNTNYNHIKKDKFKELEKKLKENKNPALPSNWEEYKKYWIIILKQYNNQMDLINAEKEFIKNIGVRYKQTGPLVNAILG